MDPSLQECLRRLDNLSSKYENFSEGIRQAIAISDLDPEMSLTRVRKVLEYIVRDVYEHCVNEPAGTRPLENLIQRLVKDEHMPRRLAAYAHGVRELGNLGTHSFSDCVTSADVQQSLSQVMLVVEWYFEQQKATDSTSITAMQVFADASAALVPRFNNLPSHLSGVISLSTERVTVVPKGLCSFDACDSDFFLSLLPASRSKGDLPDSIRLWKERIEPLDEVNFTVGVIYGPSGCGKTSLLKAGLLPRLASHVVSLYVEATQEDTEVRLLKGLRKAYPRLPASGGLAELIVALRTGDALSPGTKALIVIDQFEQWLHCTGAAENTELVQALRQVDGLRVQVIIMVRDDFWMATTRFMGQLDLSLLEGQNSAAVDLFDHRHARKVLAAFGQAFGVLQEPELTPEQNRFLDQAVTGLSDEGKIIPVRLSLFAEMVKAKRWTPATLKAVGGTEGIGTNFLEETFSATTSPARHRYYQRAARAVLKSLLPDEGSDIRGHMKSHQELLVASGYASQPSSFAELLRILDGELRLVTPTYQYGTSPNEDGSASLVMVLEQKRAADTASKTRPEETGSVGAVGQFYQLTHDYLVPSLRQWLTCKQRETRRGRAELCLEERAGLWKDRSQSRFLPGWWEWSRIRLFTQPRTWTPPQRRMMNTANRYYVVRLLALLIILCVLVWGTREFSGRTRASFLVDNLLAAETTETPKIISDLNGYRRWADPLLVDVIQRPNAAVKVVRHASLALLSVDPSQGDYLSKQILVIEKPADLKVIRFALKVQAEGHLQELAGSFWKVLENRQADEDQRLRAACALAGIDANNNERWLQIRDEVADMLATENPLLIGGWTDALMEVGPLLVPPLEAIFRDAQRPESQRNLVASLLTIYAADQADELAELAKDANPTQFAVLEPLLRMHQVKTISRMNEELQRVSLPNWADVPLDPYWHVPSRDLIQRIEQAQGMVAERFAFCQEMPADQFEAVCEQLRACGYRPLCLRPYRAGSGARVASVWTRDGGEWQMVLSAGPAKIAQSDAELRKQGYWPLDVAGYAADVEEGAVAALYSALWSKLVPEQLTAARLDVGLESWPAFQSAGESLEGEGFLPRVQHHFQLGGQPRYSGIWWKSNTPAEDKQIYGFDRDQTWYEANLFPGNLEVDVCLSSGKFPNSRQRFAELFSRAEADLGSRPEDLQARLRRGRAYWGLEQARQSSDDLTIVLEKDPSLEDAYHYRALARAQLGDIAAAKQDLAEFQKRSSDFNLKVYLDGAIAAYAEEADEGMKRIEAALLRHHGDPRLSYNAARAYAVAARLDEHRRPDKAKTFADRAVALLQQSVGRCELGAMQLQSEADLEDLRSHQGFQDLLRHVHPEHQYAAVWRHSAHFVSEELHGLTVEQQRERCKQLAGGGYRPTAISVLWEGEGKPMAVVMVWQARVIPETQKDMLSKRQAQAAVILLQLGQAESVWQLLKHRPDPRLRTYLIHSLSPLGVAPQTLIARLREEVDVSARQALILCLGEFPSDRLPEGGRQTLIDYLLSLYRDDPDPGIHSAVDWVLRLPPWNQPAKLHEIDQQLSKRPHGGRRWFVNSQLQTLAVVPSPAESWLGSPAYEPNRAPNEELRRVCIPRSFAIGMKNVTVRQFQRFGMPAAENLVRSYSPDLDGPIVAVTWFEAAKYCRWLSEQEHIEEDQMCFPPLDQIKDGMQLPSDYLLRQGYRLPTEAEWECACRMGTITSRFYGSSDDLLGKYAWYNGTSMDHASPVGVLKPNDLGLFDIYGNVWQWCHSSSALNPVQLARGECILDEAAMQLDLGGKRPLRGGAFYNHSSFVRSAYRDWMQLTNQPVTVGMRIIRSFP